MGKEKKANIIIEHLRSDGRFLSTTMIAVDVCLDEGFVQQSETFIVVKIMRASGKPYIVKDIVNPALVVSQIKKSITECKQLHLSYTIFDHQLLTNIEAYALMRKIDPISIISIAKIVKHHDYLRALGIQHLNQKLHPTAAHVLARTLPTPNKPALVSKFQYFKFLLGWKN